MAERWRLAVRGRVEPRAEAGKANAWNRFTYELPSAQASRLCCSSPTSALSSADALMRGDHRFLVA